MNYKNILLGSVLSLGLITGCNSEISASAEEIVSNVLDTEDQVVDYYGESVMKVYENNKLKENIEVKEFASGGKRKIITRDQNQHKQTTVLNDGNKLIMYEEGSTEAMSMDLSNADMPANMTQKEQFTMILETLKDTHEYKVVGEEKVLGLNTYHIKLTPKNKKSIMGEIEFWVDQKKWFIVKSTAVTGDTRTESEYKKLDFSPDFSKSTFTLQLPKDVTVKPMEDLNKPSIGTVADAEKALGKAFLLINKKSELKSKIELMELKELNRTEVNITYTKDQLPYITMSVFPIPKGSEAELDGDKVTVRGQEGFYMEEIKALSWDEKGLRYTVIIDEPSLKLDKVIQLLNEMELSSK